MGEPARVLPDHDPLLVGATKIALAAFGSAGSREIGRVYVWGRRLRRPGAANDPNLPPLWKLDGQLAIRLSSLRAWMAQREAARFNDDRTSG